MSKKLNDWLDEFVDNGADASDVTNWPENAGGGVIEVNVLPEVGKEGVVYETPDGKMWACKNTTEEEEVSDLEVGKSYKFKDEVTAGNIKKLGELFNGDGFNFDEDGIYNIWAWADEYGQYGIEYSKNDEEREILLDYYSTVEDLPGDLIEPELKGFTEIPSATITQYFVDMLEESFELSDVAFLFEGGSHTEEVVTSTWTEIGSSSGIDMSPLVVLKSGVDVTVDFSQGIFNIYDTDLYSTTDTQVDKYGYSVYDLLYHDNYVYLDGISIHIEKNAAKDQLIASFISKNGSYQDLTSSVVIYEGDVSDIDNTSSIASQLPAVTFTGGNRYCILFEVADGFDIHN